MSKLKTPSCTRFNVFFYVQAEWQDTEVALKGKIGKKNKNKNKNGKNKSFLKLKFIIRRNHSVNSLISQA